MATLVVAIVVVVVDMVVEMHVGVDMVKFESEEFLLRTLTLTRNAKRKKVTNKKMNATDVEVKTIGLVRAVHQHILLPCINSQ